jgi:hypothetical protein
MRGGVSIAEMSLTSGRGYKQRGRWAERAVVVTVAVVMMMAEVDEIMGRWNNGERVGDERRR